MPQMSCFTSLCDSEVISVLKAKLCMSSATATPPTFHFFNFSHHVIFSRGKGPLKNSSDVINAAKKIAEAGSRMDKLARAVADQVALQLCPSLLTVALSLLWNHI